MRFRMTQNHQMGRMGRNQERDARELAARKQRILESSFHVFAERTIEKVSMNEAAEACGISVATLYRHYSAKPALVLAVSTWVWERITGDFYARLDQDRATAAEQFAFYLNSFLNLYRSHRDVLRFNQFFNVYVAGEAISPELMQPYTTMIRGLSARFHVLYEKALRDHTLRTDMPEKQMFSATLHLMLAAVTRYAVGLVYNEGTDPEEELRLLKDMLMQRFTKEN